MDYTQPLSKYDGKPQPIVDSIDLLQYPVMLIDFGLACKYGDKANPLLDYFNIGYTSPELLATEQPTLTYEDSSSDLFSLAACMYEVLTGVNPLQGKE